MGSWLFMLIINMLVPVTMICLGKRFIKNAPKQINAGFGYRTSMSMKNRDTWNYAHQCCGKVWYITGWIMMVLSVIAMYSLLEKETDTINFWGCVITFAQLIPVVSSIIPVEIALHRKFDRNGFPRTK